MSIIEKKLDDFKVDYYQNEEFKTLTLNDIMGKWSIFFFYPGDFTFVCPTELGDVADHYEEFQKTGFEIYSVSTDSHFVHKAWHDTSDTIKKIKYPMLGDRNAIIAKMFEVYKEDEGAAYRGSFIVNPDGVIMAYEINDMGVGRDAKDLLRRAKAAKFITEHPGLVCPAHWEEGQETLKPGLDLVGKI